MISDSIIKEPDNDGFPEEEDVSIPPEGSDQVTGDEEE